MWGGAIMEVINNNNMGFEKFNPSSSEYKKVADLPEEKQPGFVDISEKEGGGFVRKEAANEIRKAKIAEMVDEEPNALENKINELHQEATDIEKIRTEFLERVKNYKDLQPTELIIPPEALRSDRGVVLAVIKKDGKLLESVSEEFRSDKEVVLEAVKEDGRALELASGDLRSDKEVVLEAIKQNAYAIRFASYDLQSDREFITEVVKQNVDAIKYTSPSLTRDLLFMVKLMIKVNPEVLDHLPHEELKYRYKYEDEKEFIESVLRGAPLYEKKLSEGEKELIESLRGGVPEEQEKAK
jgi:hypothetical protein